VRRGEGGCFVLQRGRSILLRITARLRCVSPRHVLGASTRPQHFAADHGVYGLDEVLGNLLQRGRSILLRITEARLVRAFLCKGGFNEAAAFCCGSPGYAALSFELGGCFNEAAAFCCGSLPRLLSRQHLTERFNEAAAFCCGSPVHPVRDATPDAIASTRP